MKTVLALALCLAAAHAKAQNCAAPPSGGAAAEPQFFDEPQFVVAGVTDNTYRGGHGADTVLRSAETLTKQTASLANETSHRSEDSHHDLATSDERSGHPLAAVQEFQRAAELNPSEPNLFDWAVELLAHRAPQPAVEVFAKGVRLFPQSVRMLLGLASALYAEGCYEQSGRYFFEAVDLDPSDPEPYSFLSKVQRREITDSDAYEQRMARFARSEPENASANYYYALTIWNRRGLQDVEASRKALELLRNATALDPHLGPAYLQLGVIYAAERRYPEAVRAYRSAIQVSPELDEAHYRLSEAYRMDGDTARSQQELKLYEQVSKQSAETIERERREIQQFVVELRSQDTHPAKSTQ